MAQRAQIADLGAIGAPVARPAFPLVPLAEPVAVAVEASGPSPLALRPGCYRLAVRPSRGLATFHGTIRVDERDDRTTVCGDLYAYPRLAGHRAALMLEGVREVPPPTMSALGRPVPVLDAPAHRRERYHAHLRGTAVRVSVPAPGRPLIAIALEEHRYARGRFAGAPRALTLALEPRPRAPGYTAIYLEGALLDRGGAIGRVTLGWVARRPVSPLADILAPPR